MASVTGLVAFAAISATTFPSPHAFASPAASPSVGRPPLRPHPKSRERRGGARRSPCRILLGLLTAVFDQRWADSSERWARHHRGRQGWCRRNAVRSRPIKVDAGRDRQHWRVLANSVESRRPSVWKIWPASPIPSQGLFDFSTWPDLDARRSFPRSTSGGPSQGLPRKAGRPAGGRLHIHRS